MSKRKIIWAAFIGLGTALTSCDNQDKAPSHVQEYMQKQGIDRLKTAGIDDFNRLRSELDSVAWQAIDDFDNRIAENVLLAQLDDEGRWTMRQNMMNERQARYLDNKKDSLANKHPDLIFDSNEYGEVTVTEKRKNSIFKNKPQILYP